MRPAPSIASRSTLLARLPALGPVIVTALGLAFAPAVSGAGLVVGSGGVVHLGSGSLTLGCTDLDIAAGGELHADQGAIQLAGNWIADGLFDPGSGTVAIVDGCTTPEASTISGDNAFYDFTATTADGKHLIFLAGSTQTIADHLELSGAPGNLLAIRSTSAGVAASLNLAGAGTQLIDYVDVQDNHATGQHLAPGPPSAFDSIDSGNTLGWFESYAAIPALSFAGLALLAAVLVVLAVGVLRRG
jgi:hypothetical protein